MSSVRPIHILISALLGAHLCSEDWRAGTPDMIVPIPTFTLSAKGPDEYANITVPANLTEDRWVVSAELRPGNRKIVHHAHVFVVEEDTPKRPAKRDPAQEYGRWLHIKEGTLSFILSDAPFISEGFV